MPVRNGYLLKFVQPQTVEERLRASFMGLDFGG
jgi:hypothetical protein